MSFDDDPDEDYDDQDVGEPDDDDPDDEGDNWHWYDDEPTFVKEEPDCFVCNDDGGPCCEPTRLDIVDGHEAPVDDPWAPAAPAAPPASSGGFADEPPF